MAGQLREQMLERNSRFEAGEIKKYRDGEADAAIENGMSEIALNYDDDAAVETARGNIYQALELKTRGMGEEAKKAMMAELDNRAATLRLSRVLENSPEEAWVWLDEHRDEFTGEGIIKAEDAVNREMKRFETERETQERKERKEAAYGVAEDYWNRYGRADMEARNAIYADEGLTNEEKDLIWNRMEAREADIQRAERQAELDYKNGWINKIIENSTSYEQAMDFVVESGASGQERLQLERLANHLVSSCFLKFLLQELTCFISTVLGIASSLILGRT